MIRSQEMSDEVKKWYYSFDGATKGPFTIDEIKMTIAAQIIKKDTMVWPGSGNWIKSGESELSELFANELLIPPPLPEKSNDFIEKILADIKSQQNRIGWYFSLAAICYILFDGISATLENPYAWYFASVFLFGISFLVLMNIDIKNIKKAGKIIPFLTQLWIFIPPVYLWKRTKILGTGKHYFYSFLTIIIISSLLSFSVFSPKRNETAIAQSACEIAKENRYECSKVKILEKNEDGETYRAKLFIENGNSFEIVIEKNSEGHVVVWGL